MPRHPPCALHSLPPPQTHPTTHPPTAGSSRDNIARGTKTKTAIATKMLASTIKKPNTQPNNPPPPPHGGTSRKQATKPTTPPHPHQRQEHRRAHEVSEPQQCAPTPTPPQRGSPGGEDSHRSTSELPPTSTAGTTNGHPDQPAGTTTPTPRQTPTGRAGPTPEQGRTTRWFCMCSLERR